jgi:hypothetical protein
MIFNCDHANHFVVVDEWRNFYVNDAVFKLSETHDSYVTQHLVKKWFAINLMASPKSLSGAGRVNHHVFMHSVLAEKMDHLKGARKKYGRTPRDETRHRSEEYYKR